ncbi:MAG: TetR/AcrR family transcriptional regulator C-terminal domain-containing protein, partial [Kineosporiaceae bacterium]|nr:TetR/AcrR family transcriptional regulator C-terminal domain-containing protein [Aeromicrobium sp.]
MKLARSGTREPVTRERAIRVAVALADAGGIESLRMRKLAAELGVEAMSLYYHVKNKDDILDGMLNVVHSEFSTPHAGDEWRTAWRDRAESTRSVLAQHPRAISIKARTSPGPATLGRLDSMIGCLRAAGFSMPLTGNAMSILVGTSLPANRSQPIRDPNRERGNARRNRHLRRAREQNQRRRRSLQVDRSPVGSRPAGMGGATIHRRTGISPTREVRHRHPQHCGNRPQGVPLAGAIPSSNLTIDHTPVSGQNALVVIDWSRCRRAVASGQLGNGRVADHPPLLPGRGADQS